MSLQVNPVEKFKNLSTKKKVAVVGATVGAAAVIGTTAFAFATGKKTDAYIKAAQAVKDGVKDAKKLNVFETIGEGFRDIGQFIQYGIEKLKAGKIKGANNGKENEALKRIQLRESFSSGMTKRHIEKHGSFFSSPKVI